MSDSPIISTGQVSWSLNGEDIYNNNVGNVGIGTDTPTTDFRLTVAGQVQVCEPDETSFVRGGADQLEVWPLAGTGTANAAITGVDSHGILKLQRGSSTVPIASGAQLGRLQFRAMDDSGAGTMQQVASIAAYTEEEHSGGVKGSNLRFYTAPLGGGSFTERMRIDATGNVGIGITTPNYPLDVRDNDTIIAVDPNNASPRIFLQDDLGATRDLELTFVQSGVGVGRVLYATDKSMQFQTQSAERMRIDSAGNVGIGTAPDANRRLHVQSDVGSLNMLVESTVPGAAIVFQDSASTDSFGRRMGCKGDALTFDTNGLERMRIGADGVISGLVSNNSVANSNSKLVSLTQAEYDALTPDADTIYFVV